MPEIDYSKEIEKLLKEQKPTKRQLAFEFLQLKLETVPLLQERIGVLEEECRRLVREIKVLECEVDCGAYVHSDSADESSEDTESEYSDRTEESSGDSESESEPEDGSTAVTEVRQTVDCPAVVSVRTHGLQQSEDAWFPFHWFVDDPPIHLSSSPSFPIDILHIVFEHLLPDMETLDFTTPGGPDGQLCQSIRMKKSLLDVSKAWHSVALGFLYRHVVLRRASQIINFARTISADPSIFGSRVRRLVFACLLPDGVPNNVQCAIKEILWYCRSLSQVSFAGFHDMQGFGGDMILQKVPYNTPETWQTQVKAGEATFTVWRVCIYSPAFANLRSLEISLWSKQADAYANKLELPLLDTLVVRYSWSFTLAYGVSLCFPVMWVMPSLKNLRFRCPIHRLPTSPSFWKFIDMHGPNLLSLSFGPNQLQWSSHNSTEIMSLLWKCPSLTHLTFQPLPAMGMTQWSIPDTIQHIDVMLPANEDPRDLVEDALAKSVLYFPGRKGVRFFENSLVALLPNLPFSSLLPRTRAEYDALGLRSPLEIDGYKVHVVPRRYHGMEVANLLFHEAAWE